MKTVNLLDPCSAECSKCCMVVLWSVFSNKIIHTSLENMDINADLPYDVNSHHKALQRLVQESYSEMLTNVWRQCFSLYWWSKSLSVLEKQCACVLSMSISIVHTALNWNTGTDIETFGKSHFKTLILVLTVNLTHKILCRCKILLGVILKKVVPEARCSKDLHFRQCLFIYCSPPPRHHKGDLINQTRWFNKCNQLCFSYLTETNVFVYQSKCLAVM